MKRLRDDISKSKWFDCMNIEDCGKADLDKATAAKSREFQSLIVDRYLSSLSNW